MASDIPPNDASKKRPDSQQKDRPRRNDNQSAIAAKIAALSDTISDKLEAARKEQEREDRGNVFREYLTLLFIVLTTIGVFAQAFIFYRQLAEIRGSSNQTEKLIDANAGLADAAKKQAEAADKQANATVDAGNTSRDALIAAQRAWVGPRNARTDATPTLDKDLEIFVDYQNSGREPAVDTVYDTDVFTATEEENSNGALSQRIDKFIAGCKDMWRPFQANVVYPSTGGFGGGGYALSKTLTKEFIDDDVVNGKKTIIITGCFVYQTVQTVHRSWFCYFYKTGKTKPGTWNICVTGNGAD